VQRFPKLLQFAIGAQRLIRRLLRLVRRVLQRLDTHVDVLECLRAIVDQREPRRDVVDPLGHARHAIGHLLERPAQRRQLLASRRQRRQHRADRGALFARRRNQELELIRLLLDQLVLPASQILEGVQHVRWLPGEAIKKRCKESCSQHNCIDGLVSALFALCWLGGIALPAIWGVVEDSKLLKRLGELFCDDACRLA
jgi:hypothetical protein